MDSEMEAPIDSLEAVDEAEDEYAFAGGPKSSIDPTAC